MLGDRELKIVSSPHHVSVGCPCQSFSSDCFISYLFSVTQPSASSTPLTRTRSASCASARWVECLAVLPFQVVSPNSVSMDEHTPINLPDSNRNFPHDCNATIAVTSEEPDVPRHSGTTSSSKHTAAASWRTMSRLIVEIDSGKPAQTWTEKPLCPLFFRSEPKGKRHRDQKRCAIVKGQRNPSQNP